MFIIMYSNNEGVRLMISINPKWNATTIPFPHNTRYCVYIPCMTGIHNFRKLITMKKE